MKKNIFLTLVLGLLFVSINSKAQQKFKENTATTKEITTKYFTRYLSLEFESLKELMHQDISFQDPTAKYIFGDTKHLGKKNVYENFKKAYAAILEMKSSNLESFFSSNVGVFKFTITWSYKNRMNKVITVNMPLVVILTIENNKVVKHEDYGDYTKYLKQIKQQQSSK